MAGSRGKFMDNTIDTVRKQKIKSEHLKNVRNIETKFPFLKFAKDDEAVYELNDAGYISPRNLVSAQIKLASSNGCDVFDDIVCKVARVVKDGRYVMEIHTESGKTIHAGKVLIACGAFVNSRDLLGEVVPDMNLCPLTVAKVEISHNDAHKIR